MATQWQGPHFIVVAAASALAFATGYTMANRSRPVPPPTPAANTSNDAAPVFPSIGSNEQAPPGRRGRPDENELIARNAEPEEGGQPQGKAGGESRGGARETERRRPPREEREEFPPEQPYEEDPGYGPEAA